jgi:hypothetical protein
MHGFGGLAATTVDAFNLVAHMTIIVFLASVMGDGQLIKCRGLPSCEGDSMSATSSCPQERKNTNYEYCCGLHHFSCVRLNPEP